MHLAPMNMLGSIWRKNSMSNFYNAEGYRDPTACEAIKNVTQKTRMPKDLRKACVICQAIFALINKDITVQYIQVRDSRYGRIYEWEGNKI